MKKKKNIDKIYFRAFEVEDYKKSVIWRNDREVTRNLAGKDFFVSAYEEKKWIQEYLENKNNKNIRLAICKTSNGEYIGNVYLLNIDYINRKAEFAIFIGEKKEWGKGYGCLATQKMLEYGFDQIDLNKIYLFVLDENEKAKKMYAKCGFIEEGCLRRDIFKNGEYKNLVVMSILREEFQKGQKKYKKTAECLTKY